MAGRWIPGLAVLVLVFASGPARAQEERTEAPAAYALDARRIRAAFQDLLGRPPSLAEREEWQGRGCAELLDAVLDTEAFWGNWLEEQLYYFLLIDNFRPSSPRVLAIPADLSDGKIDVREAMQRIALSASFDRRNPGPDTFVTVVMEQLVGTTVQKRPRELEIAKRIYDGSRGTFLGERGSSQADVVRIAVEDRQALRHFVRREHVRLLRVEPDASDLARWTRGLHKHEQRYADVLREWFLSVAYDRRLESRVPQPNRIFVRSLFMDLNDRLPERNEARRLRNALDGLADAGPLRSVLARLLLDSGKTGVPERGEIEDPTAWVSGMFARYLGRAASEAELNVFVTAFHDPACRPTTVVYAIVSHPEYQTW